MKTQDAESDSSGGGDYSSEGSVEITYCSYYNDVGDSDDDEGHESRQYAEVNDIMTTVQKVFNYNDDGVDSRMLCREQTVIERK